MQRVLSRTPLGRALDHLDRDTPGLPASAYPCGPVADEHKPIEEAAELI